MEKGRGQVKTANGVFGLGLLALLGYWVLIYPRWLPDAWNPYVIVLTGLWLVLSLVANLKHSNASNGMTLLLWVALFVGLVLYLRSCVAA